MEKQFKLSGTECFDSVRCKKEEALLPTINWCHILCTAICHRLKMCYDSKLITHTRLPRSTKTRRI